MVRVSPGYVLFAQGQTQTVDNASLTLSFEAEGMDDLAGVGDVGNAVDLDLAGFRVDVQLGETGGIWRICRSWSLGR